MFFFAIHNCIVSLKNTETYRKSFEELICIFPEIHYVKYINDINQLHAVSRTQQSIQRGPSVKTLCSQLCAKFWWRHCGLSGGTQRCVLSRHQSEEMKI